MKRMWSRSFSSDLSGYRPSAFRKLVRDGFHRLPTAGVCNGFLQANVLIIPDAHAHDFEKFCEQNSQPCPILEVLPAGEWKTKIIAKDADIRTDIPNYLVMQGEKTTQVIDLLDVWNSECVTFFLGCSFSWEEELMSHGVEMRHVKESVNVSMYATNIALQTCGAFEGNMVVSMRPIQQNQVDFVTETTAKYPKAHGGPVHAGNPHDIGILDLSKVDYGSTVSIEVGETPMFWACGVTSSRVARNAVQKQKIPWAFCHAPGSMFVADVPLEDVERICGTA